MEVTLLFVGLASAQILDPAVNGTQTNATSIASPLTIKNPDQTYSFQCSGFRVRREIRDLPLKERLDFVQAFATLQKAGSLKTLIDKHKTSYHLYHNTPFFLSWHRLYLREFEDLLQTILGPEFSMPFWDWSIDSQKPHESEIFKADYFGEHDPTTHLITNSALSGLMFDLPTPHLLTRAYNATMSPFVHYSVLESIYKDTTKSFSEFSLRIEGNPHVQVHINIGGDMLSYHAPNDLIFWLHHAFIDKIYSQWQNEPSHFEMEIESKAYTKYYGYTETFSENSQVPFYGIPVSDTLSTRKLCYGYVNPTEIAFDQATDKNVTSIVPPKPITVEQAAKMNSSMVVVAEQQLAIETTTQVINIVANQSETGKIEAPVLNDTKDDTVIASPAVLAIPGKKIAKVIAVANAQMKQTVKKALAMPKMKGYKHVTGHAIKPMKFSDTPKLDVEYDPYAQKTTTTKSTDDVFHTTAIPKTNTMYAYPTATNDMFSGSALNYASSSSFLEINKIGMLVLSALACLNYLL